MKKKIDVLISSNLWKFFKKYFLLLKFSKIMIKTLSKRNFSKLTDNHLAIINDKAYFSNNDIIWSSLISNL